MTIRQPNNWREGDLAFCIDGGGLFSAGDILKVTEVAGSCIKCGPGRPGHFLGANRFARILTQSELKALPVGAELYDVTHTLVWEPRRLVTRCVAGDNDGVARGKAYALKSLPPKHEFKVGDWVMYGYINQPVRQVRKHLTEGVYLSDYNGAVDPSLLTPLTEQEAQRLLALKDIEDAKAKLADAERRLQEAGE